jgi:hypothetical protein
MNLFSRHSSFVTRHSSLVLAAFAAIAANAADFNAVTNLTTCPQNVRNEFKAALKSAVAAGDMASFKTLLDRLGREPSVTPQVFDLWSSAAWALADDAAALAKKKPAEQAELIAGFREGGTTFGLNNRPLEIGGRPALAESRLADAESVLLERMPGKGLSVAVEGRRDATLLSIQNKVGKSQSKAAAADRLRAFALAAKPVTRDDTNAVFSAVNALFEYRRDVGDWEGYAALARDCQKALAPMYGASVLNLKGRELGAYYRADDEKDYETLAAEMAALPADDKTLAAYFTAKDTIQYRSHDQAWTKVLALFKRFTEARATMKPSDHARLTELLYNAAKARGDIPEAKARYAELEKIKADTTAAWEAENAREKAARDAKQPFTRDPSIPKPEGLADRVRAGHASFLRDKRAFADAVPFYQRNLNPRNPNTYYDLAYTATAAGAKDIALEAIAVVKTNTAVRADIRFKAHVLEAALAARDAADFGKRVAALRPVSNAEAKEGETAFDSDRRFFNLVRGASEMVYSIWPDREHHDYVIALFDLSCSLEIPELRVAYTARFTDAAPRSAEAALATGVFEKYPVENRFGVYSVYSDNCASWHDEQKKKEVKLLKSSSEHPHHEADTPGKEGALVVLADPAGVHFYIRLNDPEAAKTRDGYARGANIEFSIMPGTDCNWHWNNVSVRNPSKSYDVEWDSVMPGRKLTCDTIKVDAVSMADRHAFHIFAPWLICYDRLPRKGDNWRFVLCVSWAGQFGSLGGGNVHEFGRGMLLSFDMPDAAYDKVRLGTLRQAVGDYQSIRSQWENAGFWADPHMGDPEFWQEVVKPYLAELDEAAKTVTSGEDLDRATVDKLCREHLFDFADFRLALDAKRSAWLKAKLFASQIDNR